MEKERKLQIIRAALKRFVKHGIKKTTLDEVARDLRIGKATLYHYFKSKEDLYYQSLRFEIDQYMIDLKSIFSSDDKSLEEKINEYLILKENCHSKYKLIYELILHVLSSSDYLNEKDLYQELINGEQKYLKEIFKTPLKGKDLTPEWFSQFLIIQGWYFVFCENLKPDDNTTELLRSQINQFVSGVI